MTARPNANEWPDALGLEISILELLLEKRMFLPVEFVADKCSGGNVQAASAALTCLAEASIVEVAGGKLGEKFRKGVRVSPVDAAAERRLSQLRRTRTPGRRADDLFDLMLNRGPMSLGKAAKRLHCSRKRVKSLFLTLQSEGRASMDEHRRITAVLSESRRDSPSAEPARPEALVAPPLEPGEAETAPAVEPEPLADIDEPQLEASNPDETPSTTNVEQRGSRDADSETTTSGEGQTMQTKRKRGRKSTVTDENILSAIPADGATTKQIARQLPIGAEGVRQRLKSLAKSGQIVFDPGPGGRGPAGRWLLWPVAIEPTVAASGSEGGPTPAPVEPEPADKAGDQSGAPEVADGFDDTSWGFVCAGLQGLGEHAARQSVWGRVADNLLDHVSNGDDMPEVAWPEIDDTPATKKALAELDGCTRRRGRPRRRSGRRGYANLGHGPPTDLESAAKAFADLGVKLLDDDGNERDSDQVFAETLAAVKAKDAADAAKAEPEPAEEDPPNLHVLDEETDHGFAPAPGSTVQAHRVFGEPGAVLVLMSDGTWFRVKPEPWS